ncbi:MAG TPA: Rne/Rng family ribonuclease [Micromonosporaceae bacterium]|nr:Rne/Rng family ribonuclease [Micromonosporaceae bacterium]
MLDREPTGGPAEEAVPAGDSTPAPRKSTRKRAAKAVPASADVASTGASTAAEPTGQDAARPAKTTRKRARKAVPVQEPDLFSEVPELAGPSEPARQEPEPPQSPEKPQKATRTRRKATKAAAPAAVPEPTSAPAPERAPEPEPSPPRMAPPPAVVFVAPPAEPADAVDVDRPADRPSRRRRSAKATDTRAAEARAAETRATETRAAEAQSGAAPADERPDQPVDTERDLEEPRTRRSRRGRRAGEPAEPEPVAAEAEVPEEETADAQAAGEEEVEGTGRRRRRRGRRGRGRGRGAAEPEVEVTEEAQEDEEVAEAGEAEEPVTRRRRRRRRGGSAAEVEPVTDDGVLTVVRIRQPRSAKDEVQGVTGSTRLEAKRQRRRDGREQRRTRPPILTESEFLARRESVDRVMVVRARSDRTQIGVLEDGILVEHYVARQSSSTLVGNVYLGKVQNVLPSMEAAFVDIGRGRNAVLYAGEVNWDASGLEGKARSIEQALKSGESVLVQVTKDPVGHKGARLTSHIALSGRHLVYVPNGHASGISRKLPDVERRRLRDVLKNLVPDGAGVIVRTAAEGATEEDLARDIKRLQAQWEDIQKKAAEQSAPALLSAEPDLLIRVVRDLFNEDFRELVIQGAEAYEQVEAYLAHVSPDLVPRIRRHTGPTDVFAEYRIDEQIFKGLDRKVFLPSGGHLVIDRTEAMTVVDVNTGKYTGAGGNLEETVTRNNLEAAEEIVRQLRLRDIGGIIVIDFIDMVLESNRELVLRRLTECLGRDRTKHQVTEITSLGLVQMTRKRIGQGLLEAFSETCEHCKGRGVIIQTDQISSRNNIAEKVRAVAASTRVDQAGAQVSGAGTAEPAGAAAGGRGGADAAGSSAGGSSVDGSSAARSSAAEPTPGDDGSGVGRSGAGMDGSAADLADLDSADSGDGDEVELPVARDPEDLTFDADAPDEIESLNGTESPDETEAGGENEAVGELAEAGALGEAEGLDQADGLDEADGSGEAALTSARRRARRTSTRRRTHP